MEAQANMFFNAMFTGNPFGKNNAVILFKDPIKGKKDFIYDYKPIKPSSVEDIYPVEPECIKFLLSVPGLDSKIKRSVYELSKIPYFNNLVNSTPPNILAELANLDICTNNMLKKLFKGDITIGIFEPKTQKEVKRPVIDIGQLLYDRKNGKFPKTDLLSILSSNTLAIETCIFCGQVKEALKDEKIKYIMLGKKDDNLISTVVTASNNNKTFALANNSPVIGKFLDFIDKVPYKKIAINFEKNE